jgi:DNA-binding response OmpR family regulator
MDQYMASTEKQLLGTETTRELRAKGVTCKICGLSANDVEKAFMSAGADAFMSKPITCEKEELEREL